MNKIIIVGLVVVVALAVFAQNLGNFTGQAALNFVCAQTQTLYGCPCSENASLSFDIYDYKLTGGSRWVYFQSYYYYPNINSSTCIAGTGLNNISWQGGGANAFQAIQAFIQSNITSEHQNNNSNQQQQSLGSGVLI